MDYWKMYLDERGKFSARIFYAVRKPMIPKHRVGPNGEDLLDVELKGASNGGSSTE